MSLFHDEDAHGTEIKEHLLEQWSKCVEMANNCSDKRIAANNAYMTVDSALLAVATFNSDWKNCLIAAVGIVVSILWILSIKNYRLLNQAKYEVINAMEEKLPAAPFTEEWSILEKDKKYSILTNNEKYLPIMFIVLFSVILILPIGKALLTLICPCVIGGKQ